MHTDKLVTLYRISDHSYKKDKFSYAGKKECLGNYFSVFGGVGFYLFADNCGPRTLRRLRAIVPALSSTQAGSSAASWRLVAQYALENFPDDQILYFLEDDYLHRPGARQAIQEGLQLADYVTLYDHPDKYPGWAPSQNALIQGQGEVGQVMLTKSGHWKTTNSTTMTFACRLKTLREDWLTWTKFTEGSHPNDFAAFTELLQRTDETKRTLAVPIPGYSTHVETHYPTPLIDWRSIARKTAWPGLIKRWWSVRLN